VWIILATPGHRFYNTLKIEIPSIGYVFSRFLTAQYIINAEKVVLVPAGFK
jgi:hypothetical protein